MRPYLLALKMFFLSGCMVGPDYEKPHLTMPEKYTEDKQPALTEEIRTWWENFNDPLLTALINEAIENNYDLRVSLERIEQERARYRIEASHLWPEIDVQASLIRTRLSQNLFNTPFLGPPEQTFHLFGFDALWEIDLFGKLQRSKRAALYEMQGWQESMRDVFLLLVSDVARTYVDIIALENKQKLLEEKVRLQEILQTLSEQRFTSGITKADDTQEAIWNLQKDTYVLTSIRTAHAQAINRLATLLGKHPEDFAPDFSTSIPQADQKVPVGLPSDLLRRRPDIRQLERNLAAATEKIGAAIAELFPRLSLTGNFNLEANTPRSWFKWASRSWTIGPSIDWPLITFGRLRGQIDEKKAEQKQALLRYEQGVMLALEDVENALVAYFHAQDNFLSRKEQQKARKIQEHLNQSRYESGLENYLTCLQSSLLYLDSSLEAVDAHQALTSNLIALYKALGGGW